MKKSIIIKPNLLLLKQYKYYKPTKAELLAHKSGVFQIEFQWQSCPCDLKIIGNKLDDLFKIYEIGTMAETLKFICLSNWEYFFLSLEGYKESYNLKIKVKQLASFMLTLEGDLRNINRIITEHKLNATPTIIDHPEVMFWLRELIGSAVNKAGFIPYGGSKDLPDFKKENWKQLANLSPKAVFFVKGKFQAVFLLKVLWFIDRETKLDSPKNVAISNAQCKFLFDVCSLFDILDDSKLVSTKVQIIRSLLEYNKKKLFQPEKRI